MARVRWRVRCSATSKRTGQPCGSYAMTGGLVCAQHGGMAPQVRAAAARRLEFERVWRRIARDIDNPLALAWIRAQYAADPATFRRHRRSDDNSPWCPRVIVPALAMLAGQG